MDAATELGRAARRALERGEYALAYAEAGKALAGFQRVAALKPAWQAQQDAKAIVAEAESQELSIGVQRTKHLAGEGAFDAGGWDEARRIFREVHKEVERLIVAARPAIAAREVAVDERRRAIQVGVEASALKRADARLDEGLGRLRASRFKSSEEAFSDAAALYTAAIDKQERALAKLERESELGREADQRQAEAEKARLAAEEEKIREELARLEAQREKARAEAEREQARLEELRNKAGAQTEQEKVRKELARLEAEREKAHAEAEREQARLEQLRKQAREEAERDKARQSQTKKQREERVQVAKVETTRAAPRAKGAAGAIRSVMSEYEAAFKARNVERLNTVWAMSPFERKSLEIEMRKCSEIKIEIKIIGDPAIRGQKALVDFEEFSHWRQCRDRRRAPSWLKLRAELLLRAGTEWQIKRIWQPKD
jgi:DNA repair exonuclease SbcCD ATPase subunit